MELKVNKILVPTDFSDLSMNAMRYAGHIARQTGAKLLLLHVMESYEYNTILKDVINYNQVLQDAVDKKMAEIKEKHEELWNVEGEVKIVEGKIHQKIKQVAQDEDVDLIVMGTHGATGITDLGRFVLGSNASRTVELTRIPVLTIPVLSIRGAQEPQIQKILLPLDVTKETTNKLDTTILLAKAFDAEIHAVSVSSFFEEFRTDIDDLRRKLRNVTKKIVDEGVECYTKMLRHDSIADSVVEYSNDIDADLVVIMTKEEKDPDKAGLGATARQIINRSKVPVLSIHPKHTMIGQKVEA